MKRLPVVLGLLFAGLITSCKKDSVGNGRELIGSWVDINHNSDTLVFFNQNGTVILFDNSLSYRTIRANGILLPSGINQYEVKLGENELITRAVNSGLPEGEGYYSAKLEWHTGKREFSVEPNGFRPYLSCLGCPQRFRKID
ncbi:hypothetical protein [Flavihumibacter sp. CACIAM 22H1]|uniref:hypothetical protein n=1 Tax=Flavihumibacter sp. CACIAM 22H1 TaxID=1812911 RepID=UPI0007A7DB94|nr:hypothetical protein [Flavihumibacter sp. CACIAM 22H1]KYP15088.1 MAG: hypothetical protein A1D16_02565 [Flavihumibacter sp. CACIAM 22H1]